MMMHDKTYIKELIRGELTGQLNMKDAAELRIASIFYGEEEMEALEWQALRELAQKQPSVKRPDGKAIIGKVRDERRRKLWETVRKCAVAAVVVVGVVAFSYFLGEGLGRSIGRASVGDWTRLVEPIPSSEFACIVQWGDTEQLSVPHSGTGRLGRLGNLELWRHGDGELELVAIDSQHAYGGWSQPDIRVATRGKQQAVIKLPGGYRFRLNANTTLSYPLVNLWQAHTHIRVEGQALVQAAPDPTRAPSDLVLETPQGTVISREATFTVLATRWDTRVVLLEGTALGEFPGEAGQRRLSKQGEMVYFDSCCLGPDGETKMMLSDVLRADLSKELAWMDQTRDYKNASLRDFVTAELGRWNGVEIGSVGCIPEDMKITVSVSYHEPVETIFAHLHALGITFHEHKGMISFCGPEVDRLRPQTPEAPRNGNGVRELRDRLYDGRGLLAEHHPGDFEAR